MKEEIPVCTRCCFCMMPLRRGLLAWGYIKIIAEGVTIPIMVGYFMNLLVMYGFFVNKRNILIQVLLHFLLSLLTFTSVISDFVATIVFIVGCHKKNVKVLRGYYFYNIVMMIVTILLITSSVCLTVRYSSDTDSSESNIAIYSVYSMIIVLQTYFLLLLRSEVIKLKKIGEFRFVNNAAEARCTMICEEPATRQINEKETENVWKEKETLHGYMEKDETRERTRGNVGWSCHHTNALAFMVFDSKSEAMFLF